MTLRQTQIAYWICTALTVFIMGTSAFLEIMQTNQAFLAEMQVFGYPLYFLRLHGICKLFGIVALLVAGFPRLREWAYAGFAFTLFFAAYAHFYYGMYQPVQVTVLAILIGSYFLEKKLNPLPA